MLEMYVFVGALEIRGRLYNSNIWMGHIGTYYNRVVHYKCGYIKKESGYFMTICIHVLSSLI